MLFSSHFTHREFSWVNRSITRVTMASTSAQDGQLKISRMACPISRAWAFAILETWVDEIPVPHSCSATAARSA